MLQPEFKDLGTSLFEKLKALKASKDSKEFQTSDITAIIESVIHSFENTIKSAEKGLHSEIKAVLDHLHETRDELSRATGAGISQEKISDASNSLGEVVKVTENAANTIMDAADEIQNLLSSVSGDANEKIQNAVTKIYEACNFQDLTGQRIKNVAKTLAMIEERLSKIASSLGTEEPPVSFEQTLMNGPQSLDKAPSQGDIDAMFNAAAKKN